MNRTHQNMLSNLTGVFFISGFSALIYQVCWQRLLFTGFGVDLTSITVIISVFMAGLGIGAFFGGRIADKFPKKMIIIFCLIELGIGFFGLFSYRFIQILQDILIHANLMVTAVGSFVLLLFPTFLMGATLPLLTSFFDQYIKNIGDSIGRLYFYNTLGAAFGALATGFILFNYLKISETVNIAVALNLAISVLVFTVYGKNNEK
ncbi:fused MFS/spermidine synthase [Acinetobacter bereziniae]|uniref:fused MFS/spermidine synthase n=1 Tax=Acinetobacter bereziniae TaxID=106648 RepID=UPI002FDACD00